MKYVLLKITYTRLQQLLVSIGYYWSRLLISHTDFLKKKKKANLRGYFQQEGILPSFLQNLIINTGNEITIIPPLKKIILGHVTDICGLPKLII